MSNLFSVGRGPQIYKNWTSNKKWQEHSFVSDNASEAIAKNRCARLDESDSIQKRKRLETTYEKCALLLQNSFNVTYVVLLLHAHKCRPPVGVGEQSNLIMVKKFRTRTPPARCFLATNILFRIHWFYSLAVVSTLDRFTT